MSANVLDLIDGAIEQHGDAMRWSPDPPVESGVWLVEWRDRGTERERLVVTEADPLVLCTGELVDDMRRNSRHVAVDSGVRFTFGTDGEGLGRVTYVASSYDFARNLWLMRRGESA